MRIDWYTKGVLTVIAVPLGVIALRPYVSPDAVAHAQGSFAGLQFASDCTYCFFDARTGEVSAYYLGGETRGRFRVTKLGAPLVVEK